jgi:N-dimethylarginine dimethylaminohydrolase
MVGALTRVVVKRPEEAFRSASAIKQEWRELAYTRPPDLDRAALEHRQFVSLLSAAGAEILYLPQDGRTGMDSLYAHDAVLMTNEGAIILQTGKPARRGEGPAFADACAAWGLPVFGVVEGPATAEAGDMVWLDAQTLLAGRGFRTNAEGIQRLSELLRPLGARVIPVELPYWKGPGEVLHLMSIISLVDNDLAVVYRKLMPVPLFELLNERGVQFLDVPDEEYESLGCNVLAVSPRNVIAVSGNPITRSRLEAAGCRVSEFEGNEICLPGAGGPTCLTRPLSRELLR